MLIASLSTTWVKLLKNVFFLDPVSITEIKEIINDLKNTATGYDDISAIILKLAVEYVVNPLGYICNLSFTEGIFPDQLKAANVIQLYISDDPMQFNHYRPVSLLCVLSQFLRRWCTNDF